eukprot:Protomagalhaensia_wolfi_Nauph_80__2127@NODE_2369_length_1113_cov_7_050279_g1857_i0_p2_GENE_NODE_2369_length_1113_cov_7_050279_g1857_i0NODE_2369_length_1113_cov_7_050279_g1857_i0_p2_ORF_typecomplete_len155_score21_53_NODE_2369_length_1113_cov_7_050279_g1857_i063527
MKGRRACSTYLWDRYLWVREMDVESEGRNVWEAPDEEEHQPPRNRQEFLDSLFARDPEKLWPAPRVFVPVWKEAGALHAVVRVDQDSVPDGCFGDGERPQGAVMEPFEVHHGKFYPVDEEFVEQKQRAAQSEASQRRRAERTERRAQRAANRRR